MIWQVAIGVTVGLVLAWLCLLFALMVLRPKGASFGEALRLMPDLLRLVRGIARDKTLPVGVRLRLWLLFVYLASPIDLVPDFIPVIGFADDAILVVLVLRSVVRKAGSGAVARHWTGSDDTLAALWRLARLEPYYSAPAGSR